MKHHRVRRYTVLLSRPGQASNVYSFSPWLIGLLVGVLLFWTAAGTYLFIEHRRGETAGVRLAALSTQARQLSLQLESQKTRNNRLSRQAISLMNQLDKLEGEINSLRKRAGLPQVKPAPTLGKVPQGGGVPLDVQGLLGTTDARLAVLVRDLNRNVAPALNNRLAREGARPVGYPIDTTTYIASGFGVRRNPFGSGYESHNGDDLPAAYGTPIHATAPGRVVFASWGSIFGYHVIVDHGYGYRTLYGHMSRMAVKVGQRVGRGQVIGYVGSSGRSSGPHVHYSVFVGGVAVNPTPYLQSIQQAALN